MATTTPEFGFPVPTSTDYVKDGATAIEALGDAIDARFGDVTNYPNQIVNVVSGVSRPLPYAMAAGKATAFSTSASVTFPSGRFTQAPLVTLGFESTTNGVGATTNTPTTSGVTIYTWNATNVANTNLRSVNWLAIQMTSAASAG